MPPDQRHTCTRKRGDCDGCPHYDSSAARMLTPEETHQRKLDRQRRWREAHREEEAAKARERRAARRTNDADRQAHNEYQREWRKQNKIEVNANQRHRRKTKKLQPR